MTALLILLTTLNLLSPALQTAGDDVAASQAKSTEQAPADPPATAEELLARLEAADADLQSLSADVVYSKTNLLVGEDQRRVGRLYFRQFEPESDAAKELRRQFAIEFDTLYLDDRKEDERRSFVFDGRWLVEKLPDENPPQMFKREVVPPGETFDPLAVGEGPFPIPIGQKRADILRHYDAELIEPGDEPLEQHTWHIRLERKPEAEDVLDVETLDLWYLRKNLLPVRARAIDEGGNMTEVTLAKIERNAAPEDGHFATEAPSDAWDVEITAWDD
jgi:outer membrane lipoprotein-sorting protein